MPWPHLGAEDLAVTPIRAISWSYTVAEADTTLAHLTSGTGLLPCARISLWSLVSDDAAANPADYPDPGDTDYARERLGALFLMHSAVIPFGMAYQPENSHVTRSGFSVLSFAHVLWMFLQMEITAAERVTATGTVRQQALRSLRHDDVRVITLRRAHHGSEQPAGHRDVDWQVRWIVQGHHRHIETYTDQHHRAVPTGPGKHCAVCGARTTWVSPALKGPVGKPLKVTGQTLHRLSR